MEQQRSVPEDKKPDLNVDTPDQSRSTELKSFLSQLQASLNVLSLLQSPSVLFTHGLVCLLRMNFR